MKEGEKMYSRYDKNWVNDAALKIIDKIKWVSEKSRHKIPYTTVNGEHDDRSLKSRENDEGIYWWTNGFWGGMMWLMYQKTCDKRYLEIARISEEKLDWCLKDFHGLHHDVGFMYLPTAVLDYRLTGNNDSMLRGIHAASVLAGRFNPVGGFIRAWNDHSDPNDDTRGLVIIDSMMNIPLLYWASVVTGDPRYKHIAVIHADTVLRNFLRPDGSVCHIVEFDPETGERKGEAGGQGFGPGSSWCRGQAWGIYGFLLSYRYTMKKVYLDAAKKIAKYFLDNIPDDGLVPVDFKQPEIPCWHDDSAAAIAACGLLQLASVAEEEERKRYLEGSERLLYALYENHCDFSRNCDCILKKCTGAYHSQLHETSIIYGDYFFIEAIFNLTENIVSTW